jgi:hypothetical protein
MSASSVSNRSARNSIVLSAGVLWAAPGRAACKPWLAAVIVLVVRLAPAQEALRDSMAGEAAAESRHIQLQSLPYTYKAGDLRVLVTPSVGMDFNDNVNASKANVESDVVVRPFVRLSLSYPMTQRNLLQLTVGVGYDEYLQHHNLSTFRLQSGSELSFDTSIKDFTFNFHDRFGYSRDAAQEAAVAQTARYGNINNTAGFSVNWNLEDVTLSAGYDHQNTISPATEFNSLDKASELLSSQAGFKFNPALTAGVEGSASFTAYDQQVLNDNSSYSAGVYADWQPGPALRVKPRVGYSIYQFQHTSQSIQTSDLNSWYADLTVTHQISEGVSYSFSVGHETRLGIQQADAIQDSYLRPSINWKIIKNLDFQTFVSYEHGNQGAGNVTGNLTETYDWLGWGLGLTHPITDRLSLAFNYRMTLRSSSIEDRGYAQNLVGLTLSYVVQ